MSPASKMNITKSDFFYLFFFFKLGWATLLAWELRFMLGHIT